MFTRSRAHGRSCRRSSASLLAEGVSARDIAAVISREVGALTRQAAVIAEERMREAGTATRVVSLCCGRARLGRPRREPAGHGSGQCPGLCRRRARRPGRPWFEKLGIHIADILHEVGVPYCKGGVMAKSRNGAARSRPGASRIGDWIRRSTPQDLLSVDIFFDLRAVHGDGGLCATVWRDAFDAARDQIGFAKLLAEAAGGVETGLSFSASLGPAGAHRSEKDRAVRHRDHGARARHSPPRRGTLDAGSDCRRQGAGHRRGSGSRRAGRGARNFS